MWVFFAIQLSCLLSVHWGTSIHVSSSWHAQCKNFPPEPSWPMWETSQCSLSMVVGRRGLQEPPPEAWRCHMPHPTSRPGTRPLHNHGASWSPSGTPGASLSLSSRTTGTREGSPASASWRERTLSTFIPRAHVPQRWGPRVPEAQGTRRAHSPLLPATHTTATIRSGAWAGRFPGAIRLTVISRENGQLRGVWCDHRWMNRQHFSVVTILLLLYFCFICP